MTPEGRIAIDIFPGEAAVKIASSRPLTITRQFSGQLPKDVVRTVSTLFATCRAAQAIASAETFEDALGLATPESTKKVRGLLVLTETAREHTLRIMMDWPQFLRAPEEPQAPRLQKLMHIDRDLRHSLDRAFAIGGVCAYRKDDARAAVAKLKALLEQAIFREELERWQAIGSLQELEQWARASQTLAQRLLRQLLDDDLSTAGSAQVSALPPLDPASLGERLFAEDAEHFIAQPDWGGLPRETSPLTRSADHPLVAALKTDGGFGLVARLTACLSELSRIPAQMLDLLDTLNEGTQMETQPLQADGFGVGQIEAARGRLVHAVELMDETVSRYRILAPTEWNFHPQGAAARGLVRIAERGGDCADLARLFVMAVDPCVGADVRVH
jgi:uptake hydrogenase large subunit